MTCLNSELSICGKISALIMSLISTTCVVILIHTLAIHIYPNATIIIEKNNLNEIIPYITCLIFLTAWTFLSMMWVFMHITHFFTNGVFTFVIAFFKDDDDKKNKGTSVFSIIFLVGYVWWLVREGKGDNGESKFANSSISWIMWMPICLMLFIGCSYACVKGCCANKHTEPEITPTQTHVNVDATLSECTSVDAYGENLL